MLFNSANDAVFVHGWDNQGAATRFIEVNDVACARLGYTREELLARSPKDIDSPSARPDVPALVEQLRKTGHCSL